jgi:SpoVK/Ycf46/Vps4 family AAA+-type ATPase
MEFMSNWNEMTLPGIVLFEDLDTVFDGRKPVSERNTQITFDTVLNAISGVNSRDGVFLVVTTNHPDKIDPALGPVSYADMSSSTSSSSRPGRIDTTIELGYLDEKGKELMAERIVGDWPEVKERLMRKTNVLPVQFQEMCIQAAYDQLLKEQGNG